MGRVWKCTVPVGESKLLTNMCRQKCALRLALILRQTYQDSSCSHVHVDMYNDYICRSDSLLGSQSPLVKSTHSMGSSPGEPRKNHSSRPRLSNGLLEPHFKTHSRGGSCGSSSDGLPSPSSRASDKTLISSQNS